MSTYGIAQFTAECIRFFLGSCPLSTKFERKRRLMMIEGCLPNELIVNRNVKPFERLLFNLVLSTYPVFFMYRKNDVSTTDMRCMTHQVVDWYFSSLTSRLPSASGLEHRPDVDGLRAIAVSAVVIFHAFPNHLTGGFIGVDIFFVISGYLISSIICDSHKKNSFSFAHFYGRRIRRIFPSLIIVLVACYIAGWYTLLATEYKKLGAHIAASAIFVSNLLLYGESGYFDEDSDKKPLLHLWSLGIEEQFYIVWPVLFYILWKKKINILNVSIVLMLLSFALNVLRVKEHSTETFYWPTSRVWELLIGACLSFTLEGIKKSCKNVEDRFDNTLIKLISNGVSVREESLLWDVVSIAGTLLIALSVCFITKNSVFPGWWAIFPTFGTALLILSGPTAWINKNVLSSRLLVKIGLISYPLYLWHWPLLVFTHNIVGHQISDNAHVIIILVSIFLASLTYIFIDKPLRFGDFAVEKIAVISVSMITIGFLGYYTYWLGGLSSRFPVGIQRLTEITYDRRLFRQDVCYLSVELDESKFGACTDNAERPSSTGVILWGDSYAAHLYPGFVAAKTDLRITQLTSSRCPPIQGLVWSDRLRCKQVNAYIWKRILEEKPNSVVLAARWDIYDQRRNITKTITDLRNASIKNIYLIGPLPFWPKGLPRNLYDFYLRDPLHRVPKRTNIGLDPITKKLDGEMQALSADSKINYISPYKLLCNFEGCLTRSGETLDTIMSWDFGHLTKAGSEFVVSHFPSTLLYSKEQ